MHIYSIYDTHARFIVSTFFSFTQNMFLAIINDTYSEVKAEIAAKRNEFEIGDYFKVF